MCFFILFIILYSYIKPREAVEDWAAGMEKSARKFAEAGLTLSYHNHALEFCKIDGEIQLDMLYRLAPSLLVEIDTFWIQAGGQNPIDWISKFPGRQKLLHLKEVMTLSLPQHQQQVFVFQLYNQQISLLCCQRF